MISKRRKEKNAGELSNPKTEKANISNKKKNRLSAIMKLKLVQRYSNLRIRWPKFFFPVSASSTNSSASGPEVNKTNLASSKDNSVALTMLNSEYPGASFLALTRFMY